jgi:alkylresorcinol/alkylpyrone synthase
MRVSAVGTAFPPHYYDQATLLEALKRRWSGKRNGLGRLENLHKNVLVSGRHLALPVEEYEGLQTWGQANDAWIRVAQEVGERAVREALDRAGLAPSDVDALIFASVTGIATPSLDARLMNRLDLPSRVKRMPLFGLGCVAGAAGLARAADYVRAFPDQVAVLLTVELCTLTLQAADLSVANLVASGLFGDGSAAVVMTGKERASAGPQVLASRSIFYPDSEQVMGWKISEKGFRVVLSAEIPDIVRRHLQADVDRFLAEHDLTRSDIAAWIAHPGGPRILEAMEEALELPGGALEVTWNSLARVGNISSVSVLLVLEEILRERAPGPGEYGLLMAMGPGFCSELVLLRW